MWQRLKNYYHYVVAFLAHAWYRFPAKKLKVIGVTGTSGKSTAAHMIYQVLKDAGYKVSLLSTIQAIIGGKEYDTGFHVTTPNPHELPKYLREAIDAKDEYMVIEVSSHGLDQNRAAFIHFSIGVLTTLAHEHLDYHKSFRNYAKAKFKLLLQADKVVFPSENIPDGVKSYPEYQKFLKKTVTFGITSGDQIQENWQLRLKMPGEFNLRNGLAAATVGTVLGIEKRSIKKTLETLLSLPGRFEEIKNEKGFKTVIDFAHKPDALEGVLKAARKQIAKGRIIALFGAAGKRDVLKRPMMGEISARLADITILTDEDPRFEDPRTIIDQIAKGCIKAGAVEKTQQDFENSDESKRIFIKISDRQEAINFAVRKVAKKGDIVLLCGKGHEKSMNYKGKELPWSEHKALEKALE